jgi:hypothetical protein
MAAGRDSSGAVHNVMASSRRLTCYEARQHWRKTEAEWKRIAEELQREVLQIEDPVLKLAVAALIDTLADGDDTGAFLLQRHERGFRLLHIWIDQDVMQILRDRCGDQVIADATEWLCERIMDKPITWLSWALGPLDIKGDLRAPLRISVDNIVYSFRERRLIGICLGPEPVAGARIISFDGKRREL